LYLEPEDGSVRIGYAFSQVFMWRLKMAQIQRTLWFRFLLLTVLSSMAWAQLPDSADTYIVSGSSTIQGSNPSMAIQGPTAGALIKSDISQLTGAGVTAGQVTKAYLKVYRTAVAVGGTVDVCEVSGAWTESVTYANKPAFGGPHQMIQAGLSIPTGSASQYLQIDITAAVQDWLNGTPNNGIAIVPSSSTPCATWPTAGSSVSMTIDSKESTTSSHAPEVDVVLNTSLSQIPGSIPESQVTNLVTDLSNLNINVASRVPQTAVGAANGVASLDGSGLVPSSELPGLSGLYVDLTTNQNVGGNKTFTGLFTTSDATISQKTNGDDLLFGKRATDSGPTGNLIHFKNASNSADLFTVDVTGKLTAGTVPGVQGFDHGEHP
jgi:hypothetical protein